MRIGSFWHEIWRRMPPDREIIVRTGDRVGYVRLPRWLQVSCVLAVVGAFSWIGLATHLNFNHLEIIARRDAKIVVTENARRNVEHELEQARKSINLMTRRAEASNRRTELLTDVNRGLKAEIEALEQRIAQGKAALADGENKQRSLRADIATLQKRNTSLESERTKIAGDADRLRAELSRSGDEKKALNGRIAGLLPLIENLENERDRMAAAADGLRETLAHRVAERDRVVADQERLIAERDSITGRFASLSDQLEVLESAQEQIISRFDSQTVDSIELVEKTLDMTGVDVNRLLGRLTPEQTGSESGGVGGPFIAALDETSGAPASELASNIVAVEKRVARWRGLQVLLQRLPLTVPLDSYHVTSTYGRRVDPMTKRPAMHEGIDFASNRRAEVRTTSPGKVSFVGWRGGYGKMVEIDHGLGIRTRYAHLSKIYVKAGQQVDFRDKVGQVGNTGRSTGEHLHYEVMVDGRAQDPANFMKAGQYVFKN